MPADIYVLFRDTLFMNMQFQILVGLFFLLLVPGGLANYLGRVNCFEKRLHLHGVKGAKALFSRAMENFLLLISILKTPIFRTLCPDLLSKIRLMPKFPLKCRSRKSIWVRRYEVSSIGWILSSGATGPVLGDQKSSPFSSKC